MVAKSKMNNATCCLTLSLSIILRNNCLINPKLHISDSQLVSKLSPTSEKFAYSNSVLFQKNI